MESWIPGLVILLVLSAGCVAEERLPRPDGKDLWNHITVVEPYKGFSYIPGHQGMYRSRGDHGAYIKTFVNGPALKSFEEKKGTMRPGSVIVTENYNFERQLEAITVMYKTEGYSPDYRDWFWAMYNPGGTVEEEGNVMFCIRCHAQRDYNDYVFSADVR
ncbi:MAG: cytochrome P460 family protein [Candidatus Hydrothermarchaeota archaeon]